MGALFEGFEQVDKGKGGSAQSDGGMMLAVRPGFAEPEQPLDQRRCNEHAVSAVEATRGRFAEFSQRHPEHMR